MCCVTFSQYKQLCKMISKNIHIRFIGLLFLLSYYIAISVL